MRVVERPFSEFLRHPNDVVAELAEHDVVLRRRNAPALWLTRADHHTDRREAFEATARLLRNLATHSPGALVAALEEAYAWVEFLPSGARDRFAEELIRTLLAAASVDLYTSVAQLVREWKATAEIYADPELARQLTEPLEAAGDIVAVPAS